MPFTFGGVFSRFFRILGESFVPLAIVGLIFIIMPAIAFYYGLFNLTGLSPTNWPTQIQSLGMGGYSLLSGGVLIMALLSLISISAVTEIAVLGGVGKKVDLGSVLAHAVVNCIPLFIVNLMVAIVSALGLILLIVPGIMFMLASCVAIPAYVSEQGVGFWGAVKRSFDLTRNHRWLILGLIIVGSIAMSLITGALGATFNSLTLTTGASQPFGVAFSIVQGFVNGLSTMASQIFVAAIYVCLRQSKEKSTPTEAASIFE